MERQHNNQVKKVGAGIEGARKNINNNVGEVSDNVMQLKNSFSQLEGVIKGQSSTIQGLESFHSGMVTNNNRNLEAKKFLRKVYDKFKSEIKMYLQIFKGHFVKSGKKGQTWEKVASEIQKNASALKEGAQSLDQIFNATERILAAKDDIMCQFMRVMLYKKHLLWKDMNVPYENYVHGEVKNIINIIKHSKDKFDYVPSSIEFRLPKFDQTAEETSTVSLVDILMKDFQEVIQAVQNFSNLRGEMNVVDGISKNQKVVLSLREQIEQLTNNFEVHLEKYRNLQISKGRGSEQNLADKLEEAEGTILKREQEILDQTQHSLKIEGQMQSLKEKNKQLEQEISKWHNHQLPKIKDLQQSQKSLLEEFVKVRKDLDAYNAIFQAEREQKTKILEELKEEKIKINGLVNLLGKEKRKVKELKAEVIRQEKINMELVDYLPDDILNQKA